MNKIDTKTKRMLLTFGLFALLGLQMSWKGNLTSLDFASTDPCSNTSLEPRPTRCAEMDIQLNDKETGKFSVVLYNEDGREVHAKDGTVYQGQVRAVVKATGESCYGLCDTYRINGLIDLKKDENFIDIKKALVKQLKERRKEVAKKEKEDEEKSKRAERLKKAGVVGDDEIKVCKEYKDLDQTKCFIDIFNEKLEDTDDKGKYKWTSADIKKFFDSYIARGLREKMKKFSGDSSDTEEGRDARELALELYNDLIGSRGDSTRKALSAMLDASNKAEAVRLAKAYQAAKKDPYLWDDYNRQIYDYQQEQVRMKNSVITAAGAYLESAGIVGSREYMAARQYANTALSQYETGVLHPALNLLSKVQQDNFALTAFERPTNLFSIRNGNGFSRRNGISLFGTTTDFRFGNYGLSSSLRGTSAGISSPLTRSFSTPVLLSGRGTTTSSPASASRTPQR